MGTFIPPLTPVDVRIGGRSFGGACFLELPLRPLTSSPASRSDTSYSKNPMMSIVHAVLKIYLCDPKTFPLYRLSEFSRLRVARAGVCGAAVGTSTFRLRKETVSKPNFFLVLAKRPLPRKYKFVMNAFSQLGLL